MDPERAHELTLWTGERFGGFFSPLLRQLSIVSDTRLAVSAFGLSFPNPIGLAAGADKDARALEFFSSLGFGHIEVGTITPRRQPGNPKPRVFRLKADEAIINRLGFPSEGAEAVRRRLSDWRSRGRSQILGANIGKMKETPNDRAAGDYVETFMAVRDLADYIVVNVSSPNTENLRLLQERDSLRAILLSLQEANPDNKPILVKISPDLMNDQVSELVETAVEAKVSGIIAANTTISRRGLTHSVSEQGGLSGRPLFSRTLGLVEMVSKAAGDKLEIIAVGGVSKAEDAASLLRSGAKLVQIYTALVYQGPFLVKRLNRGLLRFLDVAGVEAVRRAA